MNNFNKGNIFLLELVVDYVHLNYDSDCPYWNEETCVTFGFLNNGPIYVRENEFKHQIESQNSDTDYIKYGKSCLFSLSPAKMAETLNHFSVDIGVYKIVKTGGSSPVMVLAGKSAISLVHLYHELMGEMYVRNEEGVISKNLDGCFELKDANNLPAGRINLFLRISCFGKVLISNIKMSVKGDQLEYANDERNDAAEPHVIQFTKPTANVPFQCQMSGESQFALRSQGKHLLTNTRYSFDQFPTLAECGNKKTAGRLSEPQRCYEMASNNF